MAEITIRRHQSIFDPSKYNHNIHIIGCGATGSRVFVALVELGCMNIHCYDFDVIEDHNLANQAFMADQVGTSKVDACKELYKRKTGRDAPASLVFHNQKVPFEKMPSLDGYVFLLTDSMASRKEIYKSCIEHNLLIDGVIETRMASTHGNVLTFAPKDEEKAKAWFETLSDDETTELSPCGQPISVGTTASIIANLAVWQYMLLASNPEAAMKQIDLYLKPFDASGS